MYDKDFIYYKIALYICKLNKKRSERQTLTTSRPGSQVTKTRSTWPGMTMTESVNRSTPLIWPASVVTFLTRRLSELTTSSQLLALARQNAITAWIGKNSELSNIKPKTFGSFWMYWNSLYIWVSSLVTSKKKFNPLL